MDPLHDAQSSRRGETARTPSDAQLVESLLAGDQLAFRDLVLSMNGALLRMAEQFVATRSVAEEVVQDTWLAVVKGLHRFEARSSLRTWIYRILMNIARSRGAREHRVVPFSSVVAVANNGRGDADVEPSRFLSDGVLSGHWRSPPATFRSLPEEQLSSKETTRVVEDAIRQLPPNLQRVVWLRDVEGWTADEVCDALELTETNQRVLLHRARSKVRSALERHLAPVTS